ncbi:MAG: S9 family peptidase [Acidimicrobiales bacterium]
MSAPVAKQISHPITAWGQERNDPYAWLRDRESDPDVVSYLEAENIYTAAYMGPTAALQEQLFEEIRARVQETDLSVPVRKGPWWYYSRTVEGQQYEISCRRAAAANGSYDDTAAEVVVFDENVQAAGHEFHATGVFDVSPDHALLAFATDTNGAELYTLRFRDLTTGADLADVIPDVYYGSAWATDNRYFFYTRPDDAMRPYQVWRHELGADPAADVLVFEESDERFFVGIDLGRDEQWLYLHSGSKVTDEIWILPASDPTGTFRVVEPRQQDLEYSISHHRGRFFVTTNADGAENFKLCEVPTATPGRANWREVIGHRPDVKLSGVTTFADHLIIHERDRATPQLRVRRLSDNDEHVIAQPEAVGSAGGSANPEFDTNHFRYRYESLRTPASIFDYDLDRRERTLLKQQPVLGDFDPERYVTERLWATAPDGVEVPISIIYPKGFVRDGQAPTLLYGYGSYEASMDPYFSSIRLSLLERGFCFAIAHVRGGGELGRPWYTGGKFLQKANTFGDFIACARHLIAQGWTSPARLAIRGGSAGGLLMGAVVNRAPELFGAVVAEVPFVDVLNTISDPSLPLTVMEWEEWGNPVAHEEYFHYLRSYAPYENVEAQDYPPMLVTAGLNDPRVSYWEPAKWVAKLRATKTDTNPLLLKTEMGAGHSGPSGRYNAWRDEAFVLAFLLTTVGGADRQPVASDA